MQEIQGELSLILVILYSHFEIFENSDYLSLLFTFYWELLVSSSPQTLLTGMNKFLQSLEITFRRDPSNFRPRINKMNSVKVRLAIAFYCAFHKHANSKVQKLPPQLRLSLLSMIFTITSNEPWNAETNKTDWNPPITDHKQWPFEPV